MAKLQDRAKDRAGDVKPYLERALKDERVREDVKSAIATAREIYDQLLGGRSHYTAAAARVATDKEIHQSLRDANDDPGSLKPMCPSLPIPSSWRSTPPAPRILAS